ncbi:hypothetical protein ACO0LB_02700 [Undibacterium sp. SXout7W]|uniref:hypothetical protein n=1 Tax=Undibacterium sp. SXout7W TaxID=3413049 RepID=UPI003BEFF7E9
MKSKFALMLAVPMLTLSSSAVIATSAATPDMNGSSVRVTSAASTEQATPSFFVVTPDESPKQTQGVQIDTPKMTVPEKTASNKNGKADVPIQVWSGPVPLAGGLWILVASMPVLASLYFAYQLLLFIQARRRRLSIRHDRDGNVSDVDVSNASQNKQNSPQSPQ